MKLLIVEDDRTLNNGIALSFGGDEILQAYSPVFDSLIDKKIATSLKFQGL